MEESHVTTPALNIANSWRVSAIPFGITTMLLLTLRYAFRTCTMRDLALGTFLLAAIGLAFWLLIPVFKGLGYGNIAIFLVGLVAVCLVAGVPIAFCFGLGTLCFLLFTTRVPTLVMIGRMDEGMSSLVLLSVPVFVLLGCILDSTGMGRAIVDFLGSLLGHIRAGMSYVLLGSLFLVSGISGSKVSDMATVAPALFPEMKQRGYKPKELIALLATGAAMADNRSAQHRADRARLSRRGVQSRGFSPAASWWRWCLLVVLAVLARWRARGELLDSVRRAPLSVIGKTALVAAPARWCCPSSIRSAVGGRCRHERRRSPPSLCSMRSLSASCSTAVSDGALSTPCWWKLLRSPASS